MRNLTYFYFPNSQPLRLTWSDFLLSTLSHKYTASIWSSQHTPTQWLVMPVTCYLCGRDFGKKSIGIHLPVCIKKFQFEQKHLPKELQSDLPSRPESLDLILSQGPVEERDVTLYNEEAKEIWNKSVLVKCGACGRFVTKIETFWGKVFIALLGVFSHINYKSIRNAALWKIQWKI